MKLKTLIILAVILCIVSLLAYLSLNKQIWFKEPVKLGTKLFSDLPINDMDSLQIITSDGKIELIKKDSRWVVVQKFNFPADFSKIIDLSKKIRDLKIGRQFTASKESIDRQGLNDPETAQKPDDQKGIRILMKDKNGLKLSNLIIGKERASGGGHYVMPAQDPNIYLVDKSFAYFDKNAKDWLDKEVINIKEEEIVQALAYETIKDTENDTENDEVVFELKREAKGKDPELIFPELQKSDKKTLDTSKAENIFSAISPLNIDDVIGKRQNSLNNISQMTSRLELHLLNNIVYKLYPGKMEKSDEQDEEATYLLRIEVSYEGKDNTEKAIAGETQVKSDAEILKDLEAEARELNDKLNPWIFEIPKWKYSDLIVELSGILKTESENSPENNED